MIHRLVFIDKGFKTTSNNLRKKITMSVEMGKPTKEVETIKKRQLEI